MDNKYVVTLSGKVKNFDALHYAAALLESKMKWCTLIPLDASRYVTKDTVNEFLKEENGMDSLALQIHKQKIDMSNALYVYFYAKDLFKDYKTSDTLKEIKYAMSKDLDIYFSELPKDINDDYTYNEYLGYYIKPSNYSIIEGGNCMIRDPIGGIPYKVSTLNIIKISYLEPKLYERARYHGLIN